LKVAHLHGQKFKARREADDEPIAWLVSAGSCEEIEKKTDWTAETFQVRQNTNYESQSHCF
jgi:hypothetical protein